jgi:hypothetical protein
MDGVLPQEAVVAGLELQPGVVVARGAGRSPAQSPQNGTGCREAGEKLKAEGYPTQFITDARAFLIDGDVTSAA